MFVRQDLMLASINLSMVISVRVVIRTPVVPPFLADPKGVIQVPFKKMSDALRFWETILSIIKRQEQEPTVEVEHNDNSIVITATWKERGQEKKAVLKVEDFQEEEEDWVLYQLGL